MRRQIGLFVSGALLIIMTLTPLGCGALGDAFKGAGLYQPSVKQLAEHRAEKEAVVEVGGEVIVATETVIKNPLSNNPSVARITGTNPLIVKGMNPGTARIMFIDNDGNLDIYEVWVTKTPPVDESKPPPTRVAANSNTGIVAGGPLSTQPFKIVKLLALGAFTLPEAGAVAVSQKGMATLPGGGDISFPAKAGTVHIPQDKPFTFIEAGASPNVLQVSIARNKTVAVFAKGKYGFPANTAITVPEGETITLPGNAIVSFHKTTGPDTPAVKVRIDNEVWAAWIPANHEFTIPKDSRFEIVKDTTVTLISGKAEITKNTTNNPVVATLTTNVDTYKFTDAQGGRVIIPSADTAVSVSEPVTVRIEAYGEALLPQGTRFAIPENGVTHIIGSGSVTIPVQPDIVIPVDAGQPTPPVAGTVGITIIPPSAKPVRPTVTLTSPGTVTVPAKSTAIPGGGGSVEIPEGGSISVSETVKVDVKKGDTVNLPEGATVEIEVNGAIVLPKGAVVTLKNSGWVTYWKIK